MLRRENDYEIHPKEPRTGILLDWANQGLVAAGLVRRRIADRRNEMIDAGETLLSAYEERIIASALGIS